MDDRSRPRGPSVRQATTDALQVAHILRPDYEELYISASAPEGALSFARAEAAAMYGKIATLLAEQRATVVQERLYGALAAQAAAEAGRAEAVSDLPAFAGVQPTYIEGMPCGTDGLAGLHLCAIAGAATETIQGDGGPVGQLVRTPQARFLYLSGLRGTTPETPLPRVEQATAMFDQANALVAAQGFAYRDVVRTWIYIGDILAWYDEFNDARNKCYTRYGLLGAGDDYLPASTGIQGRSAGQVELTMDLLAIRPEPGSDLVTGRLHNPLQNEAYAYGSAFARAMEVVTGGVRNVYVSGTASIDEFGRSIHQGDIDAQIERTVRNVEALIGTRGLTLDDIFQATIFVEQPECCARFRELCEGTRLAQVGVCMLADVCRADLLFEIDAVAAGVA